MAQFDTEAGMSGATTGAALGLALAAPTGGLSIATGAAIGGVAGLGMGFMKKKKGIDYGWLDRMYGARKAQIGVFGQNLAASRAKYMTSLQNMYTNAYARFSGTAEAGFASRGMSVSGGAFAATLARETGRMSDEGAIREAGMEREDLGTIDSAYAGADAMYASGRSGGSTAEFGANRDDARALGGFAANLASQYIGNRQQGGDGYNAYSDTYGNPPRGSKKYPVNDNPLNLSYRDRVA